MMTRLTKRHDFLAAAKAMSQAMPGLVVQMRKRQDDEPARVGFTCTKKLGNAVARNRIKRRIREAARVTLPGIAQAGHDYVLIGRASAANRDFEALRKDIISALSKLNAAPVQGGSRIS